MAACVLVIACTLQHDDLSLFALLGRQCIHGVKGVIESVCLGEIVHGLIELLLQGVIVVHGPVQLLLRPSIAVLG